MKILFVCKHNRFRSKVAEVIARKLDKTGRNEYKSAGVQLDLMRPYVAENVKKIMEEKGYEIKDEQAREINEQDLRWADKIVIVADNVSPSIFKDKTGAEIEIWVFSDCDEKETRKIKGIVDGIEKRVKKLVSSTSE